MTARRSPPIYFLSIAQSFLFFHPFLKLASFVKCYYGVNEGSLFPLRQGLFFMKPALFLPKADIEQVFDRFKCGVFLKVEEPDADVKTVN